MCTWPLIFTKEAYKGRLEELLHFLVQMYKRAVWDTKLLDSFKNCANNIPEAGGPELTQFCFV